jgi:tRNA/tmRNA/rRNA uracil-C5-methylase (TrmA/RlmC/RlmD family)
MQHSLVASYSEMLLKILGRATPEPSQGAAYSEAEPLAFLPYGRESAAKQAALEEFWKINRLPGKPEKIHASPLPRHYRTTTKRRVFHAHGRYRLRFSHRKEAGADTAMLRSDLEPNGHEEIYRYLGEKINSPSFLTAAKHLNYIIIRGTYTEFSVIFNVHGLSGPVVRNVRALAENLQRLNLMVVSAFIFFDPTRSDYYLDKTDSGGSWKCKTLFGPETMRIRVLDQSFLFKPLSFSQINESMLPVLVGGVSRLIKPDSTGRLVDLYCGYGLFAIYLGKRFGETYGIDVDPDSIDCGRRSARHASPAGKPSGKMHFRLAPITPSSLESLLPLEGTASETILLDPPRGGPGRGVISYCCERRPVRVVHLFCDIDRVPEDIAQWRRGGYWVRSVAAFDMFPGTPNLEVAVMLEPMAEKSGGAKK